MLAGALLALLAFAIYLPHIIRGGWYLDDWITIARMSEASGLMGAFDSMRELSYRPGLAFSLSLFYTIAGQDQTVYLVIGVALAAIQGWLFYLVMRVLRVQAVVAAIAAAIFIVLPVIDSTRLWLAAFPIQVSATLYLLGVLTALHGVAHARGRRALAWHAGAVCLYVASMLTYELVAGLIAVTPLLYAARSGCSAALRRALPDLGSIVVVLAIIAPRAASDRDATLTLGFLWDRAVQILVEAEKIFRWLLPSPEVLGGPVGLFLLLAGILGAGIAIGRRDHDARGFAGWARIAALGAVFALAGLVMLLPADPYFVPRISGMGNRTGAFAAFGAVLLLMALIVLAFAGLGALLKRPRLGFVLATVAILVTGANLAVREVRQQGPWADAWQQEQSVIADIDTAIDGRPPDGTGIVSFNHTTFILPADVSVFAYSWDLYGALWETYDQPELAAQPWVPEATCGPAGIAFPDESTPTRSEPYGYRKLLFVDVSARAAIPIRTKKQCEAEVAVLTGQPPA